MNERYVVCVWVEGSSDPSGIHPEDLSGFTTDGPYFGRVFKVVSSNMRYLRVAFGALEYRVKRRSVKPIKLAHCFEPGSEVAIVESDSLGTVRDVIWHHKDEAPNYYLRVNGKKKSRRYLPNALRSIEAR